MAIRRRTPRIQKTRDARGSTRFFRLVFPSVILIFFWLLLPLQAGAPADPVNHGLTPSVFHLKLKGAISPATSDRLLGAIERAEKAGARALLVQLDTPGGLMTSMDEMIRRILSSSVPVILYVGPAGASCGSAGVYLMYASHIAAMAPATNIGSATPVSLGGGGAPDPSGKEEAIPEKAGANDAVNLKRKILNHSVARIRSLATFRGRNVDFAEKAVLEAENITSEEALRRNVIDFMAQTPGEVLKKASGHRVRMLTDTITLDLDNAKIVEIDSDFRFEFLAFLSDPAVAGIFMMIGVLGILAEIQYPGSIFPGIIGAISLLIGLYAMQTIPAGFAGSGLILLGLLFFILEIFTVSMGFFTIAGVVSMILGVIMVFPDQKSLFSWSAAFALGTTLAITGILVFLIWKAGATLRKPPHNDHGLPPDRTGVTRSPVDAGGGQVFAFGEIWQAISEKPIPENTPVKILERQSLTLLVAPLQKSESE